MELLIGTLGYFLLGDSLNTTVTVISTLQNSVVSYNTLELTYLLIAGIAAQVRAPSYLLSLYVFNRSTTGSGDLRLLVHPATLQTRHQNHVQHHCRRNYIARWLGHDRHLDTEIWFP